MLFKRKDASLRNGPEQQLSGKNLPKDSDSRSKFRDLDKQTNIIDRSKKGEMTEREAESYLGGVPYEVGRASAENAFREKDPTEPRR